MTQLVHVESNTLSRAFTFVLAGAAFVGSDYTAEQLLLTSRFDVPRVPP